VLCIAHYLRGRISNIRLKTRPTMSLAKKLLTAAYYTATVDHWSITGQPIVRSSSLRQCMRFAARFNNQPSEAEINVYQHVDGHDPRLVARRRVADRFWKYVKDN
jgi:hypothetical protein